MEMEQVTKKIEFSDDESDYSEENPTATETETIPKEAPKTETSQNSKSMEDILASLSFNLELR